MGNAHTVRRQGDRHYTGLLVVGVALLMLFPLATAVLLGEWRWRLDYLVGVGVALGAGFLLMLSAPSGIRLSHSNALIVTGLAWLAASLAAAVPLALSGNYGSFLDAAFDAMSGLTTSGLTLAQNLDHMSLAHNMWRHMTHLIAGRASWSRRSRSPSDCAAGRCRSTRPRAATSASCRM